MHFERATPNENATEIVSTYKEAGLDEDIVDQKILNDLYLTNNNLVPVEQNDGLTLDDIVNGEAEDANDDDNQDDFYRNFSDNQASHQRRHQINANDLDSDSANDEEDADLTVDGNFDDSRFGAVQCKRDVSPSRAANLQRRVQGKATIEASGSIASCNTKGHLLTVDNRNFDVDGEITEPLQLHQYSVTNMHKENLKDSDTELWKLNRNQGIYYMCSDETCFKLHKILQQ
jgi:hypothetical protein